MGLLVGMVGAVFFLFYATIAGVAGYGLWTLREWGRILSIALAVLSLVFSLPGLLMMGVHLNLFFGTYRLVRIAISILMIWYLMQAAHQSRVSQDESRRASSVKSRGKRQLLTTPAGYLLLYRR